MYTVAHYIAAAALGMFFAAKLALAVMFRRVGRICHYWFCRCCWRGAGAYASSKNAGHGGGGGGGGIIIEQHKLAI